MKQGKSLITFVILAFTAVLALYFGYYVFHVLNEPYRTAQVYSYTANDSVIADGLVVRDALLLPAQNGILEITLAEGEKVGKGQQVALVYRDSQAQASQAQIEELEMDIQLLEEAIAQPGDLESAARLDEDILQSVVDLRASYALGDYTQLRAQAMAVKSGVLKRGYTYGEGMTAAGMSTRLRELLAFLDSRGIPVSQVSGASTGTVEFKAGGSVYTELQAGSYLFMDSAYHRLGLRFQNALFIQATVISTAGGRIVTDAGIKCCGVDQGPPVFVDFPSCVPVMSEEHSAIYPSEHSCRPGDRLTLIPGHCCTTMNLHDRVFLTRGGCVMDCIPITSRGKCM